MKHSTLCYIFRDNPEENKEKECLFLLRDKKENDINSGKWTGVGGHFDQGETPEECLLREVKEETGLTLQRYVYRGLVTFLHDSGQGEFMHLFTADRFSGQEIDCDEGSLAWKEFSQIFTLPRWEGDDVFLRLLSEHGGFFHLTLQYQGDVLQEAILNGNPL